MSAAEAAKLINDGDTVGLMGGGGLMEASFLAPQTPRSLTMAHALGIGDKKTKGMNCFAHEGLVKRVIGGHWVWSPAMPQLAEEEKIEAYILPGCVSSQLLREIGAGRPGLFTHVGLGTVCDPRQGGGRMNALAKDDLAEVVQMDGREYLRYKPFPIHVALVCCASAADEDGNISFEHEAANLDEQITYSGPQGLVRRQEVLYLTERASFRLTQGGIELFEIAPGIDLQRDVLDQMAFAPRVAADLKVMDRGYFQAGAD